MMFSPLTKRTIPIAEISQFRARTFAPLREYGGWGLRGWGGKKAYSTSGNRGVELVLQDGQTVMIGSQRADALAQAIAAAKGK